MSIGTTDSRPPEIPPRVNEFRRFTRVFLGRGLVVFGLIVIIMFILLAIFGPWVSPYQPQKQDLYHVLEGPSSEHLLGTDHAGRDILSRVIYGARISLLIGVVALGIAAVIGMLLGMIAGYFGGWVYAVIMRVIDLLMSFPPILLALLIAALLGSGLENVMIAIGISLIPAYARLMCGQVMSIKENDYVMAGISLGSSNIRIIWRHLLPNSFPPLIVLITMQIGMAILAEAGLSFLGVGIAPPAAAWGTMVADGYRYLDMNPILSFAPGLALMLVVFAFNMVGDGLRDALDPRLRGSL